MVEAARRLGISPDAMKRYCAVEDSKSHVYMPWVTYQLFLLLVGAHPEFILVPRQALLADHMPPVV